ncbi:MAG TPA: hypothetical protein VGX49_00475 [Jatrophihabitans sp.]|nr:hypothetical protein [Jatrophihabitans sp.]
MTSLCLTADIPILPGLRFVDRILATGPRDESCDDWTAAAVSAHLVAPITQAAAMDSQSYARAACVAEVLGVELYPRLRFTAIDDHWALRQRLRAAGVDHTEVAPAPDRASVESYVAEHGLPCLLRPRYARHPAVLLRSLDDVDRAARGEIHGAAPGDGMLIESAGTGQPFQVVVLVEGGHSEALVVLRPGSEPERWKVVAGPVRDDEREAETLRLLRSRASNLAPVLGLRDGLLVVDLGLDANRVSIAGVRLGSPGEPVRRAVLHATGVDLALCCARQCYGQPAIAEAIESARAFAQTRSGWHSPMTA